MTAVLVMDAGASGRTVPVMLITGSAVFAASEEVRLHVNVCAASPHDQPLPPAVPGVSDAGRVSVTTIGLAGRASLFAPLRTVTV